MTRMNSSTSLMPADAAAPASRWRRRHLFWALAVLAAAVVGTLYGLHWWRVGRFLQSTDDAYVRADVVPISPRVTGYVVAVNVDDNQSVSAGDVLMRIDDRDYRARVQQAEAAEAVARAAVAAKEAALGNLDAQLGQQRSRIAKADADLRAADAEAGRASLDAQRFQSLVGQSAVSRQQAQLADAESRKADAAVAARRADAVGQRDQVGVLRSERRQREAALEEARAELLKASAALRLARIDLENTLLRAPVDGVVGQRAARVGQYVEPGLPMMALVPLHAAYVVANYKETQLHAMLPGQPVALEVDTFSGLALRGRVDSLSPASGSVFALLPPDNATGNFTKVVQRIPVKIRLDATSEAVLRPGMSVIATVDTRPAANGHAG